jgi:hypothetical protein
VTGFEGRARSVTDIGGTARRVTLTYSSGRRIEASLSPNAVVGSGRNADAKFNIQGV